MDDQNLAQDHFEELADRVSREHPESWIPSESDPVIVGRLVRVDTGYTAYGENRILVLETKDGIERGVWLLHVSLKDQLRRARPKVGQLVAIRYCGTKQSAGGQSWECFRVAVQTDQDDFDWEALDSAEDGSSLF